MFIEFTRLLPFWVIGLSLRFKLFSLQLVFVSAVDKRSTPSSVIWLRLSLSSLVRKNPDSVRCQVTTSQSTS